MDLKVEASNDNWGENPYKPPIEKKIAVIPASPGKYIYLIYIFAFLAFLFTSVGLLINIAASFAIGFVFATIATLLAFFEWV